MKNTLYSLVFQLESWRHRFGK